MQPVLLDRDVQNLELEHACGNLNLDNLADLPAKQRLSDRCANGELTLAQVCLVLRNDGVLNLALYIVVQELNAAQNLNLRGVNLCLVDDACLGECLLELRDAHLQKTLSLAGCVILCILREVTLVASLCDSGSSSGALNRYHVVELLLKFVHSLSCEVDNLVTHNICFLILSLSRGYRQTQKKYEFQSGQRLELLCTLNDTLSKYTTKVLQIFERTNFFGTKYAAMAKSTN